MLYFRTVEGKCIPVKPINLKESGNAMSIADLRTHINILQPDMLHYGLLCRGVRPILLEYFGTHTYTAYIPERGFRIFLDWLEESERTNWLKEGF